MKLLILLMPLLFIACNDPGYVFVPGETVTVETPVDHYFESKTTYVTCESDDFDYNECIVNLPDNALDIETRVYTRHSNALCHEDETFGWINEYTLYVNDGCRARFRITYNLEVIK